MSSTRTYDAALPLPSVFVEKMKSLNDCFNMAIQVYQIPFPAGGREYEKVFHPGVLRLETTRTTRKNNLENVRGLTRPRTSKL